MVPLIGSVVEFRNQEEVVRRVAHTVFEETGVEVPVIVGTMIETPRAALTAGRIAEGAEFFSYGSNDLTQTTMAISRDDAGAFVPQYVSKGIFPHDPFQVLDTEGVGELIRMASKNGKMQRPDMPLVCAVNMEVTLSRFSSSTPFQSSTTSVAARSVFPSLAWQQPRPLPGKSRIDWNVERSSTAGQLLQAVIHPSGKVNKT